MSEVLIRRHGAVKDLLSSMCVLGFRVENHAPEALHSYWRIWFYSPRIRSLGFKYVCMAESMMADNIRTIWY
jgi:hypothetical protein